MSARTSAASCGYAIRSFVAASRLELRATPAWLRREFSSNSRVAIRQLGQDRPLQRQCHSRYYASGPASELSSKDLHSPSEPFDGQSSVAEASSHGDSAPEPTDHYHNLPHDADAPIDTIEETAAIPDYPHRSGDVVPWYLQIGPPQGGPTPTPTRQQLPPLPPHNPPILPFILDYVSVDLGMDDLSLIDLRGLDPPPALGPNLIMLLGTARSEKHLHVSADRFCRWLRAAHRLRPHADGHLGRNELKLRLRRKAKRSRLLSTHGAAKTGSIAKLDDGIRTGWICVDVGVVEGGVLPLIEPEPVPGVEDEVLASDASKVYAEGFVGFGDEVKGTKIVVQLMTEERREQLELETLWGGILRRSDVAAGKDAGSERAEQQQGGVRGSNPFLGRMEQRYSTGREREESLNPFPEAARVN